MYILNVDVDNTGMFTCENSLSTSGTFGRELLCPYMGAGSQLCQSTSG